MSTREGSQSSYSQFTQSHEPGCSRVSFKLPVCFNIDDSGLPLGHQSWHRWSLQNSISLQLIEVQMVFTELTHTRLPFLRMYIADIRNQGWALLLSMFTCITDLLTSDRFPCLDYRPVTFLAMTFLHQASQAEEETEFFPL